MDISSGYNICLDEIYQYSKLLVNRMLECYADENVLKNMDYYAKRSRSGLQGGTVKHKIRKREFSLPKNFFPVTKSRLKSFKL